MSPFSGRWIGKKRKHLCFSYSRDTIAFSFVWSDSTDNLWWSTDLPVLLSDLRWWAVQTETRGEAVAETWGHRALHGLKPGPREWGCVIFSATQKAIFPPAVRIEIWVSEAQNWINQIPWFLTHTPHWLMQDYLYCYLLTGFFIFLFISSQLI